MKQLTIFGDIHGNLPALQAVLAEIDGRGLTDLYCLGDLVGYGTWPNEVIEIVRDRRIPTIMGNYDQGVGQNSDDCGCAYRTVEAQALGVRSITWTNEQTTALNKAYLRTLPAAIPLQLGDQQLLLVHGSPRRVNEYLYEDRPETSMERIMDAAGADLLVCGHTHLPYHRVLASGRQVINAGSVGKPKDGDPRAGYVVLTLADDGQVQVAFNRVTYDVEKAAQAIEATAMPDEFAVMLRVGSG